MVFWFSADSLVVFHTINNPIMFYLKILLFSIFGIPLWVFWETRYLTIAYWIALGEKGVTWWRHFKLLSFPPPFFSLYSRGHWCIFRDLLIKLYLRVLTVQLVGLEFGTLKSGDPNPEVPKVPRNLSSPPASPPSLPFTILVLPSPLSRG